MAVEGSCRMAGSLAAFQLLIVVVKHGCNSILAVRSVPCSSALILAWPLRVIVGIRLALDEELSVMSYDSVMMVLIRALSP